MVDVVRVPPDGWSKKPKKSGPASRKQKIIGSMSQPRDPYTPPRETTSRLEMPVWTIDGVFRAAYRQFRAQPVAALIALGVLPALWNLPAAWARITGVAWLAKRGQEEIAASIGVNVLAALWEAVIAGGAALIALDVARGRTVDLARYRDGLPVIPAMFAIGVVLPLGGDLYNRLLAVPENSDVVLGMPAYAVVLGATLAALVIGYFAFRWSLATYPIAERVNFPSALGRSYAYTGHAQLQYFVLLFAAMLVMMPFLLVGFALPEPLYGAPLALVMPLVSLVYANVVVAFESRQS